MKFGLLFVLMASLCVSVVAQSRSADVGRTAVVLDESLSLLRKTPSLYSETLQRMRRGRLVKIEGVRQADGVTFYRVTALPEVEGWVQSDALFANFRPNDEQRLASLVQAATGFEQIDLAVHFFDMFPRSKFRPALMLLFGDILEVAAVRLSREANNRLRQGEMAATAAPLHSYFLSYVGLDRYRKLGIKFLFNPSTRNYHYDGASWNAIVRDHANSPEVEEAQKRLQIMKERMEAVKK